MSDDPRFPDDRSGSVRTAEEPVMVRSPMPAGEPRTEERRYPDERYPQPYDRRYEDYDRDYRDDRRRHRPAIGEEASRFAHRYLHTPETKDFFRTSEFFLTILLVVALMVGAAANDFFDAEDMWPLVTLGISAYVISRGIAKAGTRTDGQDWYGSQGPRS
jgi:hypothetical protein